MSNLKSGFPYVRFAPRAQSLAVPNGSWLADLNPEHGVRAWPLLTQSLSRICTGKDNEFRPEMALDVLPKLMNSMYARDVAALRDAARRTDELQDCESQLRRVAWYVYWCTSGVWPHAPQQA